jgi:glycosyltransferase involved in cell wall biosynthesis
MRNSPPALQERGDVGPFRHPETYLSTGGTTLTLAFVIFSRLMIFLTGPVALQSNQLVPPHAAFAKGQSVNTRSNAKALSLRRRDHMPAQAADNPRPLLLLLGVHTGSEGYPNVRYRLADLKASHHFQVEEINIPLLRETARHTALMLPILALRGFGVHLKLLLRIREIDAAPAIVYVPYPSITVLNLLPKRLRRARIVADAFISIYDTIVNDRQFLRKRNPLARLLHFFEKRALHRADLIITDTPENADFLHNLFQLPRDRLEALPLSTNEADFRFTPYRPNRSRVRVLFIGTMVPLHGAVTIAEAAGLLRDRRDIEFRLVGTGQDARLVEKVLAEKNASVTWIRQWQSPRALAEEIRNADICLGIFGNTEKAQRVCPFKIYAYASMGRAIVTADTAWVRNATANLPESPFAVVPVDDPRALADKILHLATNPPGAPVSRTGKQAFL